MAEFSIEIASKTIPLFAGNYEDLESFIITAELVNKTLSDTAKQDFLEYIYHAKLTSNVRTAIGSFIKPDNFDSLKELLRQRYRNTKTVPELQSKLTTIYQGKLSVNMFKERITNIVDNLNKLGIEELGDTASEAEKNVITRLNNKLALDAFKRGINENLKTAIFAARPKSMQDALDLALELENEQKLNNNNKIMQIRSRQPYNSQFTCGHRNCTALHTTQFNRNNNFNRHNNNTNMSKNYNSFNRNNTRNNNTYNNNRNYNYNANNYQQKNNRQNNNNNRSNQNARYNDRRHIHTIQNQGNEMGSEYTSIPNGQS